MRYLIRMVDEFSEAAQSPNHSVGFTTGVVRFVHGQAIVEDRDLALEIRAEYGSHFEVLEQETQIKKAIVTRDLEEDEVLEDASDEFEAEGEPITAEEVTPADVPPKPLMVSDYALQDLGRARSAKAGVNIVLADLFPGVQDEEELFELCKRLRKKYKIFDVKDATLEDYIGDELEALAEAAEESEGVAEDEDND